jgi:prolipoprotein diacylglyceryltransferase
VIAETEHAWPVANSPYGLLMLAGIGWGLWRWHRRTRHEPELMLVIIGALAGGFLGAKLAYLFAEGRMDWNQPDRWLRWATGKSVLGGLLGAFVGVEAIKRAHGIRTPTGDGFALSLPFSLFLGRIGCILHGCCLGRPWADGWCAVHDQSGIERWPAPHVEAVFQLLMLGLLAWMRRTGLGRDRLFYAYLIAYGTFRFAHEFLRATPRMVGPFSGYHLIALLMATLGTIMWRRRTQERRLADPI